MRLIPKLSCLTEGGIPDAPHFRLSCRCLLAVALPFGALAQTAGAGSIAVTGEARMTAPPDMASVMLGVVTRSDSAAAALSANSDALARVLERLAAAGIEARDLQTTGLSLNPDWDHSEGGEARIRGYVASNQVTARVRDLGSLVRRWPSPAPDRDRR
jgi:uncharacterized protein